MTVSYAAQIPNGSSVVGFWKLLFKWRGSVYHLVWRELLAFTVLGYSIFFLYSFGLNEYQQRKFDSLQGYFKDRGELMPMSFVMGFYVSMVVTRWWEQYRLLPWPDTLALIISTATSALSPEKKEKGRLVRRSIMRYMLLAYVATLMQISLRVKKRFPSWQHLVDAGLLLENEKKIFEIMDQKSPMSIYWTPLVWASNIVNTAREEELITSDNIVQTFLVELSDIRRRLSSLIGYNTVCVPLVYTQVVTLVVYTYFLVSLAVIDWKDSYFPFFTSLQFIFYVGWLKVAQVLINPFGEDDDDIELNWLIDRHIKASYTIVDGMHDLHPELQPDKYWDQVVPKELPYTIGSQQYRKHEPKGSTESYKIKPSDALYGANDETTMVKRIRSCFSRLMCSTEHSKRDTP